MAPQHQHPDASRPDPARPDPAPADQTPPDLLPPDRPQTDRPQTDLPQPDPAPYAQTRPDQTQPEMPPPDPSRPDPSPPDPTRPNLTRPNLTRPDLPPPDPAPPDLPPPGHTSPNSPPPGLTWRETDAGLIPVSTRFDDPYYSLAGGLAETAHVFHAGNDLPARFRPGFHIAELGFGTGLNFLATCALWQASAPPGPLHFTSFEAFPLTAAQIARSLAAFPGLAAFATRFLAEWATGNTQFALGPVHLTVITGDARSTLPHWPHRADAWFLDGFAPAKNPELWSPELMAEVARHTAPGGTCASYTAAGHVRRGLQAAGFQVQRRQGFGRKRHMTTGRLTPG